MKGVRCLETSAVSMLDLTGIDLSGILDEIVAIVPTILPVSISFIAFRKAFAFLLNALHGA